MNWKELIEFLVKISLQYHIVYCAESISRQYHIAGSRSPRSNTLRGVNLLAVSYFGESLKTLTHAFIGTMSHKNSCPYSTIKGYNFAFFQKSSRTKNVFTPRVTQQNRNRNRKLFDPLVIGPGWCKLGTHWFITFASKQKNKDQLARKQNLCFLCYLLPGFYL